MRSYYSKGRTVVALSALTVGLAACSGHNETRAPAWDDGDFSNTEFGVGEAVAGCSNGTGYTASTGLLQITGFTGTVVISAPGGVLKMNGINCVDSNGAVLKVTGTSSVVKKIAMASAGAGNKVLVDLYAGPLTTVFAGTAGTGLDVTFSDNADAFLVRGTSAIDKVNVTQVGSDSLYFDMGANTDGKADAKVTRTGSIATIGVKVSLAAGADVLAGMAGPMSWDGTALASPIVPAGSMTVYGGDGADLITDGDGSDVIYGGAGNDTIKASNGGNDTLIGGDGVTDVDLIDYSARTAAVNLTLSNDTNTLTFGLNPGTGKTVTINSVVYTFVTALATGPTVPGEVLIGTDAAASVANLIAAINGAAGSGTTYTPTATSPNADVTASAGATTSMMDVTAKTPETTPALATSTDVASALWASATLVPAARIGSETDRIFGFKNAYGGNQGDVLRGDAATNVLYGGAGADTLYGGSGADTIYGGNDNDKIYGGDDDVGDVLYGELGDDTFYSAAGADGADTISGGNGADTMSYAARTTGVTVAIPASGDDLLANDIEQVIGGTGADSITCGPTACTVFGGDGNDTLTGGNSADYISGDAGNDSISGAGGNDLLLGELGLDTVSGGDGDDTVSGGDGDDSLSGDAGNDQLFGGNDIDHLVGGTGVDMLSGGPGDDDQNAGGDAGDLCVVEGTDTNTGCDIM